MRKTNPICRFERFGFKIPHNSKTLSKQTNTSPCPPAKIIPNTPEQASETFPKMAIVEKPVTYPLHSGAGAT